MTEESSYRRTEVPKSYQPRTRRIYSPSESNATPNGFLVISAVTTALTAYVRTKLVTGYSICYLEGLIRRLVNLRQCATSPTIAGLDGVSVGLKTVEVEQLGWTNYVRSHRYIE